MMTLQTPYFNAEQCQLKDIEILCNQTLQQDNVPNAVEILHNAPIYSANSLNAENRRALMAEWAKNLHTGSGVVVIKNACQNHDTIDLATKHFYDIIAHEKSVGAGAGDHFAQSGANDRIWNSLQKLCIQSPETFARYFATPAIDAVCEGWLGPHYQMTTQLNLVHPGGAAQSAHRDYHLGFQTADQSAQYPAHVHTFSPFLTLQGAIAHVDIPIESGATKLLPFSQNYPAGFSAFRRQDFRTYFEAEYIQLPLKKGDAVFFNPALFHAAGENRTSNVHRMVNLLQISSAFGRAMESVNRDAMCRLVYPILRRESFTSAEQQAIIAATAEGYSFPTNLDRDPPIGGLAPETQADVLRRGLQDALSSQAVEAELSLILDKRNS